MKKILYPIWLLPLLTWGQQPVIDNISPTRTEVEQTVTIIGSHLGGNNARVFFGSVESPSVTGTDNLLEVETPAGAIHAPITVLNTSTNLVAQSDQQFFISYNGETLNRFESEHIITTNETDAYDICLCDLNNDNLNDIIISHNVFEDENEITIFTNQSTSLNSSFSMPQNINNDENTGGFISTTCGDLNKDGFPELIFTTNLGENANHIFIYENPADGSTAMRFVRGLNLHLPDLGTNNNRIPRRIKLADIDVDGRLDLVVGNEIDGTIHIFRNTSHSVVLQFDETPIEITVNAVATGAIEVADLNRDGRQDIITLPFDKEGEKIYILRNQSIRGNIQFVEEANINEPGRRVNVVAGDFDNDGRIDIASTDRASNQVSIYRNTSTSTHITFSGGINIGLASPSTRLSPWGIDLGDINGDGWLDIAVACAENHVYILENTASLQAITFTPIELLTTTSVRNICVGDLNADAKPDLALTHNVNLGASGNLGVFINRNPIVPKITPASGIFCATPATFTVFTTKSTADPPTSYNWTIMPPTRGVITNQGDRAIIEISSAPMNIAEIQVEIGQPGTPDTIPSLATFDITADTPPIAPSIVGSNSITCIGDALTLNVNAPEDYDIFEWFLPDGTIMETDHIDINAVQIEHTGSYRVRGRRDPGCFSNLSPPFEVTIEEAPVASIINYGCTDSAITMELDIRSNSRFTYKWFINGTFTGKISTTLQTNSHGTYTVEITTLDGMCTTTSEPLTVPISLSPQFGLALEKCLGIPVQLASATIPDNNYTLQETWEILKGGSPVDDTDTTRISGNDPLHFLFNRAGTYTIRLTSTYSDFQLCPNYLEKTITISDPPAVTFNTPDMTQKCQLETLTIGVTSPEATRVTAYKWVIKNASDQSVIDESSDKPTVNVDFSEAGSVYAVVAITTDIGCEVVDSVQIDNFDSDIDISSPSYDLSNDTVILNEDNLIVLQAENVSNAKWEPQSVIENPTASRVTVFPSLAETTVTLNGMDANNCEVKSTLFIILDNVRPRRTFSPNDDGLGFDCWEILNTSDLKGCTVYVFDARGKNILVKDSPFANNCVWDGNYDGSPVSEGVYYYVLKCTDATLSKSGSILLAR